MQVFCAETRSKDTALLRISYKLLVFGHRSLTKNITQTAVINILKTRTLNVTFRMLVDIHFQKYNRYNF